MYVSTFWHRLEKHSYTIHLLYWGDTQKSPHTDSGYFRFTSLKKVGNLNIGGVPPKKSEPLKFEIGSTWCHKSSIQKSMEPHNQGTRCWKRDGTYKRDGFTTYLRILTGSYIKITALKKLHQTNWTITKFNIIQKIHNKLKNNYSFLTQKLKTETFINFWKREQRHAER